MERQRSFSFKSTRALVFSLTIFSSILFSILFSIFYFNVPSSTFKLAHHAFNKSSITHYLKPKKAHTFATVSTNFTSSEDPTLAHSHLRNPASSSSGRPVFSDLQTVESKNNISEAFVGGKGSDETKVTILGVESSNSEAFAGRKRSNEAKVTILGEESSSSEVLDDRMRSNETEVAILAEESSNSEAFDGRMRSNETNVTILGEESLSSEALVDRMRSNETKVAILAEESSNSSERSQFAGIRMESMKSNESEVLIESKRPSVTGEGSNSFGKIGFDSLERKRIRHCDVFEGKWVLDECYPLYNYSSCPFIDEGFNCQANGRMDKDYTKWRWQPHNCNMPRFNASKMLELLRGKRLVFVGDSINRNQWESLLCLLRGAVADPKRVYETHGRRITKEKGNYCFKFMDYRCTVEFYVSHFLVHESKARIGQKRKQTLRIDTIDKGSSKWKGADILIFNTAHWWSHYKTKAGINYYQEGNEVHHRLDVYAAFRRALTTWAQWVDRHITPGKTQVFFRSSSPSHFRGGQWNSGGHCMEGTWPLNFTSSTNYPEKSIIVEEVIKQMSTPVTLLNITNMSELRIDGHPSIYGQNPGKVGKSTQDCSHWCLPGVPDAWNELLYFYLLSKQKPFSKT